MPNVPGPQTSCVMSLSTLVQMFCPGTTDVLLLCFARIFSVMVKAFFTCRHGNIQTCWCSYNNVAVETDKRANETMNVSTV
jgi:hypothetical protein